MDNPPFLLELPFPLCEKHLAEHDEDFMVKFCSGWMFLACPVNARLASCHICKGDMRPVAYLGGADLRGADLRGALYTKYTLLPDLSDERKKEMILIEV